MRVWRSRTVVFFTAFAFLFQSLVLQTHVHGASGADRGLSGLVSKLSGADELTPPSKSPGKPQAPSGDSRCPICQAAQSAGSFIAPGAIFLVLPWQNVSLVPVFLASKSPVSAVSHDWQGRAPPRD